MSAYRLQANQEPYLHLSLLPPRGDLQPSLRSFTFLLIRYYKHRKWRMSEHLFSNTSKKDMLYSCFTMRTHNNNIYVFLLCKCEYLLIFPARFCNEFIWNPILYLVYIAFLIIISYIFFNGLLYLFLVLRGDKTLCICLVRIIRYYM